MGAWGSGLYQDDEACDLRDSIKVLAKLPWTGDKLLSLLLDDSCSQDSTEASGSMFWLVVADQFERKGITCHQAFDSAIQIITSGQDIANLRQLEMSERDLRKREGDLQKLLARLTHPRPERKIPANPRQPAMVVETGQIYVFPAMQGYMDSSHFAKSFNAWFSHWGDPAHTPFSPDSWGAFIVLATGRAYDWLPWAACCPLLVPLNHKASLDEAIAAALIHFPEYGFDTNKPNALHLKRMQAQCIGSVSLDTTKVTPLLPSPSVINEQVAIGRSFCSVVWNIVESQSTFSLRVADLLKEV